MATLIPAFDLLGLYASGWFPMADGDGRVLLHSPDPRGILPIHGFHLPHGARKTVLDPAWEVRIDTDFAGVIQACASRRETWIDGVIMASYQELHRLGSAHSVEVWRDGQLAGGLYGVRLGGAFFGESMFHRHTGASKVALAALVAILSSRGYQLLDIQWVTGHLAGFGATAIPRREYLRLLGQAVRGNAGWPARGPLSPEDREATRRLAQSPQPDPFPD